MGNLQLEALHLDPWTITDEDGGPDSKPLGQDIIGLRCGLHRNTMRACIASTLLPRLLADGVRSASSLKRLAVLDPALSPQGAVCSTQWMASSR